MIYPKEPSPELIERRFLSSLRQASGYYIDAPEDIAIKIDQNEMPFDWPEELKEKVCDRLKQMNWNRYPPAYSGEVTELVAQYARVPTESVITAAGSDLLITTMIRTLSHQLTGKIVIAQPSFPIYENHCNYEGINYTPWMLNESLDYDIKKLPDFPPNSLLVFASPNNPVGNVLPKDQLRYLLENHPDSIIIADEAYVEFSNENYADLLSDYDNLILTRTFSKTFGAAGLRLGYGIAAKGYISQFNKLRHPYLLNIFTIAAIKEVLNDTKTPARIEKATTFVLNERDRVFKELTTLAGDSFWVKPSYANFLLVRFANQPLCEQVYTHLIDTGILVRNVSKGPQLARCLRVTIGQKDENDRLIASLSEFMRAV